MKFFFLLFSFFTCICSAYDGIEECKNTEVGVYGIAHESIGPRWEYTYMGQVFKASVFQANGSEVFTRVVHMSEKIISYTCNQGQLNRKSIRRVILRDQNNQPVIDVNLLCEGSFPHGMFPPPRFPLCQ